MTTPVNFNVANADHNLQDKDKAKYDSLKARMQNEQKEFLRQLRSKAFADHTRYTGCHKQAADQIEVIPLHVATGNCQHVAGSTKLLLSFALKACGASCLQCMATTVCHVSLASHDHHSSHLYD